MRKNKEKSHACVMVNKNGPRAPNTNVIFLLNKCVECSEVLLVDFGAIKCLFMYALKKTVSLLGGEHALDLLEGHEHNNVPAAETHEVCCETLVESQRSLLGDHAGNESSNTLSIARLAVHNSSLEHVDGGSNDAGNESGTEGTEDVGEETIGHTHAHSHLLELIVSCELGGIDHRVTHHVRGPTDPQALDAILGESF